MQSKTQILGGAILLYACIIFVFGLVPVNPINHRALYDMQNTGQSNIILTFFLNAVTNIGDLGFLNIILFIPLLTIIGWVIISSFPTLNGGA